jgi:dihydropteroate synthase
MMLDGGRAPFPERECAALGLSRTFLPRGGEFLARLERLPARCLDSLERTVRDAGAGLRRSGPPGARVLAIRIPHSAWPRARRRLLSSDPPLPLLARQIDFVLQDRPARGRALLLPRRRILLGRRTLILGILNVTPDSFFDGGRWSDPGQAVERAHQMAEEGAGMVDIGGESTRPGSRGIPAREEMRRILPVISALKGRLRIPISVDTTKAEVAEAALGAGAEVINDVSGLTFDPRMAGVAGRRRAGLILSHIRGRPRSMQRRPRYRHLLPEVMAFLRKGIRRATEAGVRRGSILIDPGIGFGKTPEHNRILLRHLPVLRGIGCPVVVGASRKSFLSLMTKGAGPADRLEASLGVAAWAALHGASVLRVHDVAATVRVIRSVEMVSNAGALRG